MKGFGNMVFLLLLVLSTPKVLAGSYLSYEAVGTFDEIGRCYSGAIDPASGVLAAGCESGIFWGRAERLRKLPLECPLRAGSVIRLRLVDTGTFVASTPCGLFVFGPEILPHRLAIQAGSGAMAVVDGKTIVIDVDGSLFMVDMEHAVATRMGRWPSASRPLSLEWSSAGAISQGFVCRQGQAPWRRFLPPVHGARAAQWDDENILWIGPRGRLWMQNLYSSPVAWGDLHFGLMQRMRSTKTLGKRSVWVRTDYKWFLLGAQGVLEGLLPKQDGPFVPMRSGPASSPPVLLGRGVVLKVVERTGAPENWCSISVASYYPSVLMDVIDESTPSIWLMLLPQVYAHAGMGRGLLAQGAYGSYGDSGESDFRVFLGLQWPMGSATAAQLQVQTMRNEFARRRRTEQVLVQGLMASLQLICTGHKTAENRLELQKTLDQLRILGVRFSSSVGSKN